MSEAPDQARLADLRVSYDRGTLDEADLAATPLEQFRSWLTSAIDAAVYEPNAMVLGTTGAEGQPSARTVLLKEADARGFVFFTNYGSRKSQELSENPGASLVFPWYPIHRQVTVVGRAERIPREESSEYFDSRPHGSRIGAWASRQSSVIDGRGALDERYAQLSEQYPEGAEVPLPDFWGGWLVRPVTVEFWQGRVSRLHDRLRFRALADRADLSDPSGWTVERLSP